MMYPNPFVTPDFIRQVMEERLEAYGVPLDKRKVPEFDEEAAQSKPAKTSPWLAITSLFRKRNQATQVVNRTD
jgi:hypothetical protein